MTKAEFIKSTLERKWKAPSKGTRYINMHGYNILYMLSSNDDQKWTWRITPEGNQIPTLDEWSAVTHLSAIDAQRAGVERLAELLDLR